MDIYREFGKVTGLSSQGGFCTVINVIRRKDHVFQTQRSNKNIFVSQTLTYSFTRISIDLRISYSRGNVSVFPQEYDIIFVGKAKYITYIITRYNSLQIHCYLGT